MGGPFGATDNGIGFAPERTRYGHSALLNDAIPASPRGLIWPPPSWLRRLTLPTSRRSHRSPAGMNMPRAESLGVVPLENQNSTLFEQLPLELAPALGDDPVVVVEPGPQDGPDLRRSRPSVQQFCRSKDAAPEAAGHPRFRHLRRPETHPFRPPERDRALPGRRSALR